MIVQKRKVEIFSAGCSVCEEVIKQIRANACPSCEIEVLDMRLRDVQRRAQKLGVNSIPAVAINSKLTNCCSQGGVDIEELQVAGLGKSLE